MIFFRSTTDEDCVFGERQKPDCDGRQLCSHGAARRTDDPV